MALGKVINFTKNAAQYVCDSIYPANVVTKRHHIQLIPEWFVNEIGEWSWYVACPKSAYSIEEKYTSIINEVGQKLAETSDRPDFEWKFFVKRDYSLFNVACFPGGKIFITEALIKKLDPQEHQRYNNHLYSDDETVFKGKIAAVLGHEMAHVCAAHGASQMQFSIFFILISNVAEAVTHFFIDIKHQCTSAFRKNAGPCQQLNGNKQFTHTCVTMIFSAISALLTPRHSSRCETEADIMGMKYAHLAGYKTEEMIKLVTLLGYAEISNDNWLSIPWLNFHPIPYQRRNKCWEIKEILDKSADASALSLDSIQTQLNQMKTS